MYPSMRFVLVWSPVAATAATFVWLQVWSASAPGLLGQMFDRVTIGGTWGAASLYLLGLALFERSIKEDPSWLAYTWVMIPCFAANSLLSIFGRADFTTSVIFVLLLGASAAGSIFLRRRTLAG